MRLVLVLGMKVCQNQNQNFNLSNHFEGIDATHNPEFSTCEFYQAYATLEDLIGMTEELIKALVENQKLFGVPQSLQGSDFKFKRLAFLPTLEEQIQSRIPGFRMPNLSSNDSVQELLAVLPQLNIQLDNPEERQSLPHILDVFASHLIEPLCKEPTFITGYPTIMSPLAKSFIDPESKQELSARAELFINSTEYVNLYEEENDPYQQTMKFLRQVSQTPSSASAESLDLNKSYEDLFQLLSPSQKYYIRVLEMGLPPTGGWGCGMERLTMLLGHAERIGEVLPFGTLRNVIAMGT
jgi:lysyl-tRNA synthetase, class II